MRSVGGADLPTVGHALGPSIGIDKILLVGHLSWNRRNWGRIGIAVGVLFGSHPGTDAKLRLYAVFRQLWWSDWSLLLRLCLVLPFSQATAA